METEIKYLHLLFKPTKNIFKLPAKEAEAIMVTDRYNYEIVDEGYVEKVEVKPVKTTTFEQVVGEQPTTAPDGTTPTFEDKINDMTVRELIEYCDKNNIKYSKKAKKADLQALILGANK